MRERRNAPTGAPSARQRAVRGRMRRWASASRGGVGEAAGARTLAAPAGRHGDHRRPGRGAGRGDLPTLERGKLMIPTKGRHWGMLAVLAILGALLPEARLASAQFATEFPLPTAASQPTGITTGPDGALWFTEQGGGRSGGPRGCQRRSLPPRACDRDQHAFAHAVRLAHTHHFAYQHANPYARDRRARQPSWAAWPGQYAMRERARPALLDRRGGTGHLDA